MTFAGRRRLGARLAEVWGARVRQISHEQHIDELMLLNHSEAFFENAGRRAFVRSVMLENPHPQPAGGVLPPARRVRAATTRATGSASLYDADARDRRRARHPRADLEVARDRRS